MMPETFFAFPEQDTETEKLKNTIERQREEIRALEYRIATLLGGGSGRPKSPPRPEPLVLCILGE